MKRLKEILLQKINSKEALKFAWGVLIWFSTLSYLLIRREYIIEDKLTLCDKIIGIIFILFTLLPFIKEIDIFGIKVKKDIKDIEGKIEKYRLDINNKLLDIRQDISNNNISNITNNLNVPFVEGIINEEKIKEQDEFNITDEQVFCFKVRTKMEEILRKILRNNEEKYGKFFTPLGMMRKLSENEIINQELYEDTRRIYTLCNRSIHGEILPKEYNEYIRNNYKVIIKKLEKIIS